MIPRAAAQQPLHRPAVLTPLSRSELLVALWNGHLEHAGFEPSKNRLAMAWAQVAGENLHGKIVYNHNLGNVGPYRPDQPYFVIGRTHRYRHFEEFIDGAKAYWGTVRRCTSAMRMFDAGNPAKAAEYLRKCGYYEADLDVYSRTMTSLYWLALRKVIPEEERERQARERQEREAREWEEYQLRTQFTPDCACSRWWP
jgi:hypothetical protein